MSEQVAISELDCWSREDLPSNVRLGEGSIITKDDIFDLTFKHFRSRREPGLAIGNHCTLDGAHFNIGERGQVSIGDYCHFQEPMLLCEVEIRIGNYVFIGWHATLVDADFHPISPAERLADVQACSPQGKKEGRPRPAYGKEAIHVGNDVYIGPLAVILKGVQIGDGAFIEPGAVVVRDVPAGARMIGNPAVPVESSSHGS